MVRANRQLSRRPYRVPCRLRVLGGDGVFATLGETVNISQTGLAVQLATALPPGAQVEVLLPHLDGEPTCFYGQVVHRRRVLTGTFEIGIVLEPTDPVSA